MTRAVVFLGPTATAVAARAVLDCDVLPPARQGDLFRIVRDRRPAVIGLVDGAFLDVRPVWHREILWAMTQGVTVFGAASMGALRAAELYPFGMRGVGRIYEAYRAGAWPGYAEAFEDDDEVAVIHAPPEAGGAALSDAMVDIRDTLLAAEAAGIVSGPQRERLTSAMKGLHFAQRNFARLAAIAGSPELTSFLATGTVGRKRLDALALLHAVAGFLSDGATATTPDFVFQRALVWENFRAEEEERLDDAARIVLDELRRDPDAFEAVQNEAAGLVAPAGENLDLDAALDRLRRRHGLWRHSDLTAWMMENALTKHGMTRLLKREAARHAAWQDEAAMIAHLRLSGRFAEIWRRAAARK